MREQTVTQEQTVTHISRRAALQRLLLGPQLLGLRALASGIPAAMLMNPQTALAQLCEPSKRRYLLLSASKGGDPLNCNVPGTWDDPKVIHSLDPLMAKTPLTLGTVKTSASKPWAALPQKVLDRTLFFHHSTRTNNHANQSKVMRLMEGKEMLPSFIAKQVAACLGSIQQEPLSLGASDPGEALSFEGRPQPNLSPLTLKALLAVPDGSIGTLQKLRDDDVNRLNAIFREQGTASQRAFLDRWATSQQQARNLSTTLLQGLSAIADDGPKGQAIAAATLFKLNVTPVLTMHIPFGGDNHSDTDLAGETRAHQYGVPAIADVMAQLEAVGLQDNVNFAMLNVFGRELKPKDRNGRSHLADHHCSVLIGPSFVPGIVGGIEPTAVDYGATAIDAKTGASVASGGIARDESLASLGKTIARAMGVPEAAADLAITGGRAVSAFVR